MTVAAVVATVALAVAIEGPGGPGAPRVPRRRSRRRRDHPPPALTTPATAVTSANGPAPRRGAGPGGTTMLQQLSVNDVDPFEHKHSHPFTVT